MNRSTLRKHAFLSLFQIEFQDDENIETLCKNYLESREFDSKSAAISEEDKALVTERVKDIISHLEDIDETITKISDGWAIERIGKVELSILRLAVYEIKYDSLVPLKVAINEAVELAKKYGGDNSSAYINAVLAKLS